MSPSERAWQMIHAIDVAQTLNGPASDACYREVSWGTRSLLGEQPSRESVIAWGVGVSVLHYFAGRWLDESDWPEGVKLALRSVDIAYKGITVARNHDAGIRPFGDNVACGREPRPMFRPDAQPVK